MVIMLTDLLNVKHYIETIVDGEIVKTLVQSFNTRGALMPAALTEVSDAVTETVLVHGEGFRLTDYKKLYTTQRIMASDIITEMRTGNVYKIMKVYDYSQYGTIAKHYKYIVARVEN